MKEFLLALFRSTLSFLLLFAPAWGFGQQVQKVVTTHQNPAYKEEYSVLSTNKAVKQGAYRKYSGKNNLLLTSGYYSKGQKDSTWTTYYPNSEIVRERGSYELDQKVGMWEFYTPEGTLEQNYDYTYRQVLFSKAGTNDKCIFKLWSEEDDCRDTLHLERKPVYIGGLEAMQSVIRENLKYPAQALQRRITGTAKVAFLIDAEGKTSDYRVVKKLGGGCDAEALRVAKLLPATWVPARLDGRAVTVVCELPVVFALPTPAQKSPPGKSSKRKYVARSSSR
ncbi:energy transducer TonB [Hymenobacter wooponensis]|uniref:TonB family protein n=1 Tax=Hymenobacter wooponensis TaxID=1525360 RepID=A0A4Z0MP30_9BACT|nr:energy transducer TonB [Hymenobacter wooponensis]TGD81543.1 TonB family protein [Hymenobacter wooponensis]